VPKCDCAGRLLISDSESFRQKKADCSLGVGIDAARIPECGQMRLKRHLENFDWLAERPEYALCHVF
jgi:hypothetical protein